MSKKRKYPIHLQALRALFPLIEKFLPFVAKRIMYRFFFYPLEYPYPDVEVPYIENAESAKFEFEGEKLMLYQWGNLKAKRKILLVHGWAGRATQFWKVIEELKDKDIHIISYDAPGHGNSSGRRSSLPQFARIVTFIQTKIPFQKIIAHSLGGAASIYAIANKKVAIEKIVLIGAPTNAQQFLADFVEKFNGDTRSTTYLKQCVKKEFGTEIENFFADHLMPLKNFPKALAIHDKDDSEVHACHLHSLQRNLPELQVFKTKELGHTRILRDDTVIRTVTEFLLQESNSI